MTRIALSGVIILVASTWSAYAQVQPAASDTSNQAQQISPQQIQSVLSKFGEQLRGAFRGALNSVPSTPDLRSINGLSLPLIPDLDGTDYFAFNPYGQKKPVTARYKFEDDADWTDLPALTLQNNEYFASTSSLIPLPPNVTMFSVEFIFGDCPRPVAQNSSFPCTDSDQADKTHGDVAESTKSCCILEAIFLRDLRGSKDNLIPAVVLSKDKMLVSRSLIVQSQLKESAIHGVFTIDGYSLSDYFPGSEAENATADSNMYVEYSGWATGNYHFFAFYPSSSSCRPYDSTADRNQSGSFTLRRPGFGQGNQNWRDNGIRPDFPKVFDVFTLRQMLATTAAQLAGVSGFSASSITGAFGNIQGVTSDVSYLSAQVTTVATPIVSSVVSNGNTGSNTIGGSSSSNSSLTGTNTTINCPAGTLPGIGTAGLPACVLVVNSASGTGGNPVGFTGAGNTNGGSSSQGSSTATAGSTGSNSFTNVLGTNQTNSTTTNSGGQSGTVAPTPVANAPSAPTNIGVSSQDILAEQVQLNSQITTLRMALQGALSDQYLIKEGKVVSTRKQTTLGFNMFLDPPARYKHAVAEVRVWVYPAKSDDSMSVVNLLPAAKTYNVAKITSNQKAFGAGVVIDPVNVGVAAGKSKNRLYLAKDTDTVALEYYPSRNVGLEQRRWKYGAELVERSAQEHIVDLAHIAAKWQSIANACVEDPGPELEISKVAPDAIPLVFGWQFRPVLGADYVQSGNRQVFAQLALPVSSGSRFSPLVFIQTRWREYDAKRQVVGPVFEGSCSIRQDPDVIEIDSPLVVHSVAVDDMGGGIVKVSANGRFFQQAFSVMTGPTTIGPATFDGQKVQFFANAASLLLMDDLKLASEDGKVTDLAITPYRRGSAECGMTSASLVAVPRPDGSSLVEATIQTGPIYNLLKDSPPQPLFLIGSQVYGLHETPFLAPAPDSCTASMPNGDGPVHCVYHFTAPTDITRGAQTFTVRDLRWQSFKKSGPIEFDPSLAGLAILASAKAADTNNVALKPGGGAAALIPEDKAKQIAASPVYAVTGNDFQRIQNLNCKASGCLELYRGLSRFNLSKYTFETFSKTNAVLTLKPQAPRPYFTTSCTPAHSCKITISDDQNGAVILYTLDGALPDINSSQYEKEFTTAAPAQVNAIALASNTTPSEVASLSISRAGVVSGAGKPKGIPADAEYSYKSYRFIWHPRFGDPIEWDLNEPTPDASAVAASQVLNEQDITDLTFSGVDVFNDKTTMNFSFNGIPLINPTFKYDATKKSLTLYITGDMTQKPGHKVILLNALKQGADGTKQSAQVLLPFDVTRR